MSDVAILLLTDEATHKKVVNGLKHEKIPYRRAENTSLLAGAEDPEIALFARKNNMVVLTDDLRNPSFTDVTVTDLRPNHIDMRSENGSKYVHIQNEGKISVSIVGPNKHSMDSGTDGHNGVIRYYQDQINDNQDGIRLAEKIDDYISKNPHSHITSNIRTEDIS